MPMILPDYQSDTPPRFLPFVFSAATMPLSGFGHFIAYGFAFRQPLSFFIGHLVTPKDNITRATPRRCAIFAASFALFLRHLIAASQPATRADTATPASHDTEIVFSHIAITGHFPLLHETL